MQHNNLYKILGKRGRISLKFYSQKVGMPRFKKKGRFRDSFYIGGSVAGKFFLFLAAVYPV